MQLQQYITMLDIFLEKYYSKLSDISKVYPDFKAFVDSSETGKLIFPEWEKSSMMAKVAPLDEHSFPFRSTEESLKVL